MVGAAQDRIGQPSWWVSSVPAATSCRVGFQMWKLERSISSTRSLPALGPSFRPSRAASSSPPAPPPTITMS
jgi:hypothetical protein